MKNLLTNFICFFFLIFPPFLYANIVNDLQTNTINLIKFSATSDENATQTSIGIAAKRYALIKNNINTPELFAKWLLPNSITERLPHKATPYLEKEITYLEGRLEIRAMTFIKKRMDNTLPPFQIVLYATNNQIYNLHFVHDIPTSLKTDQIIRINHGFLIPSAKNELDLIVDAKDITIIKNIKAIPSAFGPQNTLAVLVNFSDQPTDRPWSIDSINSTFFNDINNMFYEYSYHQTTVVGKTTGWYVLNIASTDTCTNIQNAVPAQAKAALQAAGVDITGYQHFVYIFPHTTSCTWGGLGTVGGSPSTAWINGYGTSATLCGHELGHNLGLSHSRSIRCPSSPIGSDCTLYEYGDTVDIMGNASSGHFNAYQKELLGWLNYSVSPPITTVTQSGSYFIDPYETISNRPKALKVLKSAGSSDYYYLEFRQPNGFDKSLDCYNCDYTKGIIFHQGNPTISNSSLLLDMSPSSTQPDTNIALLPCQSWTDPNAPQGGVTFSVQSISPQGARVKITYGSGASHYVKNK